MSNNCYQEETLVAYAERTIPAAERESIEQHIGQCDACARRVKDITTYLLREINSDSEGEYSGDSPDFGDMPTGSLPVDDRYRDVMEASETVDFLGKINGYDIVRVLGRGGYGIVFEAKDSVLQRNVAVKVLARDLSRMAVSRRRFIREARAGAAINHPNVVTIYGVEESGDAPLIIMELIQGETLRERIRREPKLDALDILRISAQIAQGLAAAHAQGIIHRDVKPGNIMLVDRMPRVKIADFGLARVATENVELTSRGLAVGTPAYMSPEQVRGDDLDARTDLFALGCVMYTMFTGHSPFHGRTALDIARRIETYEPSRLSKVCERVPEFVDDIVAKLLNKDPDDRFQSAAEVADLINRHLAILNQTPTDKMPIALQMSMLDSNEQPKKRFWLSAAAIVSVLAAISYAAWLLRFGDNNSQLDRVNALLSSSNVGIEQGPAVRERKLEVSVAKGTEADHTTINEALLHVAAGGLITILDDSRYDESIQLNDAERHRGLRIISPKQATLQYSSERPLMRVASVPDVHIDGLRLVTTQQQIAVELSGECPGVLLANLNIERTGSPSVSNAAVVFRSSAAGTEDKPIELRATTISSTNVGIVIGNVSADEPPQRHIRVTLCHVRGLSRESSTLLALLRNAEHVTVQQNIFAFGAVGVSVLAENQKSPIECDFSNNTWHGVDDWFTWTGAYSSPISLRLHQNLLIDSNQGQLPTGFYEASLAGTPTFLGNVAVASSDSTMSTPVALVSPEFPITSLEPDDPAYLMPDFERLKQLDPAVDSVPGRYGQETTLE